MYKYIKGTLKVSATRWFKEGDHGNIVMVSSLNKPYKDWACKYCNEPLNIHGWIDLDGDTGLIVCPGDYIVTYDNGEISPIKADLFELTYELIGE